jgi:hypothetical protein
MDPTGGYWDVFENGMVEPHGGAPDYGHVVVQLNAPIVGMAATPDGGGYWLVASDGGIFTFGDAQFHGSTGAIHLNQPIVGMAATPDGGGYWLVASDGGIFTFGDAQFHGSDPGSRISTPAMGVITSPDGAGYFIVLKSGGVENYGDAGQIPVPPPPTTTTTSNLTTTTTTTTTATTTTTTTPVVGTPICGNVGPATWNAAGSPYLLCPAGADINSTVTIDGSGGPVQITALGSGGLTVVGSLITANTTLTDRVAFDGPSATAGSWQGIGGDGTVDLAHVTIQDAVIGLDLTGPAGESFDPQLSDIDINETAGQAIVMESGDLTGGSIVDAGMIPADESDGGPEAAISINNSADVVISGVTVESSPLPGLGVDGDVEPSTATVQDSIFDHVGLAGHPGIVDDPSGDSRTDLILLDNTVTDSGAGGWPAISVSDDGFSLATSFSGNTGSGNGLDAIEVNGSMPGPLTWITPTNSNSNHPLGYINDGLALDGVLTVPDGGVIKSVPGTGLSVDGLDGTAGGAVFTSLRDNSVGIAACPSALASDCSGVGAGDWEGVTDIGDANNSTPGQVTVDSATIRDAITGITIPDPDEPNSPNGALNVADSTFTDDMAGLYLGSGNAIVTNSAFSLITQSTSPLSGFGIYAGLKTDGSSLNVSGSTFTDIADSGVSGNGTTSVIGSTFNEVGTNGAPAIDLTNPSPYPSYYASPIDTLQGNTVTDSGDSGLPAVAIELEGVVMSAASLTGNQGDGNGIDAIDLNSSWVYGNFTWVSPTDSNTLHPLGDISDNATFLPGPPTQPLEGPATLTFPAGSIVEGGMTVSGETVVATAGGATFTPASGPHATLSMCPPDWIAHLDWPIAGCEDPTYPLLTPKLTMSGSLTADGATIAYEDFNAPDEYSAAPELVASLSRVTLEYDETTLPSTTVELINSTIIGGGFQAGDTGECSCASPSSILNNDDVTDAGVYVIALGVTADSNQFTSSTLVVEDARGPTIQDNTFEDNVGSSPLELLETTGVDLTTAVSGNVGTGDMSISLSDSATATSFTWITPKDETASHPLGYVAANLTIGPGTQLAVLSGSTVNTADGTSLILDGSSLVATGAAFTNLEDAPVTGRNCQEGICSPAGWNGIVLETDEGSGDTSSAVISDSAMRYGAYPLQLSAGSATVECTTIEGNSGGIDNIGGTATIVDSNMTGNAQPGNVNESAAYDLVADPPTTATDNWWGQLGGPISGQVDDNPGPASTTMPLTASSGCAPPMNYLPTPSPSMPPTISGLAPSSGPAAGGTPVVITGSGFSTSPGATTFDFGPGNPATGVECPSTTSCNATSPQDSVGVVSVTATVGEFSATSNSSEFTYLSGSPSPTVTDVSPASGPTTGGSIVTITGTGFSTSHDGTTFEFSGLNSDGLAIDVVCTTTTTCSAETPIGEGQVNVIPWVAGEGASASESGSFMYADQ